jgi:hypothetical protein
MSPKLLKIAHLFGLTNLTDEQVNLYSEAVRAVENLTFTHAPVVEERPSVQNRLRTLASTAVAVPH